MKTWAGATAREWGFWLLGFGGGTGLAVVLRTHPYLALAVGFAAAGLGLPLRGAASKASSVKQGEEP